MARARLGLRLLTAADGNDGAAYARNSKLGTWGKHEKAVLRVVPVSWQTEAKPGNTIVSPLAGNFSERRTIPV
jgi:hypothetical protein